MTNNAVYGTRSGLITRYDTDLGLLVYSPYSGLIFAVHEDDGQEVIDWLDRRTKHSPDHEYEKALGPGWFIPSEEAEYPVPHLLPKFKYTSTRRTLHTKHPIVINWFLTGRCPLACKYCYAEDLMRNRVTEPKEEDIERIAESILYYKPLVVVLTGGEPLISPYLPKAIKLLFGKTGIVIDTNGYTLDSEYLRLFKYYNVTVRVSFDSERPEVNQYQRPLYHLNSSSETPDTSTFDAAIRALCECLEVGIPVSVQSVATKRTANDLPFLGDKLLRLGVRSWRVFLVQPSESRMKGYEELIGTPKQKKDLYRHVFKTLENRYGSLWGKRMSLQLIHDAAPNAVILVAPDGTFHTESDVKPGKVKVDDEKKYWKKPRFKFLLEKVDMHAHARRYLNRTWRVSEVRA